MTSIFENDSVRTDALCLAITTLLTIVNNFCGIMRPVASFRSNMIARKCNHMSNFLHSRIWSQAVGLC